MTVAFYTFGCKLNQSETEGLKEKFSKIGFQIVPNNIFTNLTKKPDFYIINACAVTQKAEKELRKIVRKIRLHSSMSRIIIIGCFTDQILHHKDMIDSIDLWVNNRNKIRLHELINSNFAIHKNFKKWKFGPDYPNRTRALVKIQDGCKKYCSYCIVPYLRKNLYSKPVNEIIKEIKQKQEQGFQEVVLVGANISIYSHNKINLVELLKKILKYTTIPRIRLSSILPTALNNDLIELIENDNRICPHIHLSIQSACDKILLSMNRNYTTAELRRIIKRISRIKQVNLTADIIVGFPGEKESDFKKTVEFVKWAKFLKIHVFRFSSREGTEACLLKNTVPCSIKQERARILRGFSEELSKEKRKKYLNKTISVLFESKKNFFWFGLTPNYLKIYCKSNKDLSNKIINIKTIGLYRDGILGKLCQ